MRCRRRKEFFEGHMEDVVRGIRAGQLKLRITSYELRITNYEWRHEDWVRGGPSFEEEVAGIENYEWEREG